MVDFIKRALLINRPMPWAADRQETLVEAPRTVLVRIAAAMLKPIERWAPRLIETTASDYVRDKSPCELLFLVCVLLSVLLVAVVLPLCDALLGERERDQPSGLRSDCDSRLETCKAGADVVEVNAQDAARQTLSISCGCSTSTRDRRRPRSILRSTVTFLEKIDEESDEECDEAGEETEDDSSDSSVQSTETPTSSPPATPGQAGTRATDDGYFRL